MNHYDTIITDIDQFSIHDIQVKKGQYSTSYIFDSPEGKSISMAYEILPNVHLTFLDLNVSLLPSNAEDSPLNQLLHFEYCIEGRIEMMLDDHTTIYMGSDDICISKQSSRGDSFFPMNQYRGITIYFDDEFFEDKESIYNTMYGRSFPSIEDRYFPQRNTFISCANADLKKLMDTMWDLKKKDKIFELRINLFRLFNYIFFEDKGLDEKKITYYTNAQVEIAKKTEEIITQDLGVHIPIKEIAERFGISETSLKNYFRGVYGKNISSYLRELRMTKAKDLLATTDISISEISSQVGYSKQGRFAELFRENYKINPLKYRQLAKAGTV